MKRKIISFLAVFLVGTLCFNCFPANAAMEDSNAFSQSFSSGTYDYVDNLMAGNDHEKISGILVSKGLPRDVIETCDEATLRDFLCSIYENNADFHDSVTSISIPVVDEIMDFVNCSADELAASGMQEEQIAEIEHQINNFMCMDEKQATKVYHISKAECKILRDAVTNGNKYRKKKSHTIQANGTIASSMLSLTINNSISTVGKNSKSYHRNKITSTFCWSSIPIYTMTDYLAITWGGSVFNIYSASDSIRYYKASGSSYQNVSYSAQIGTAINRGVGGATYQIPFTYYTTKDRGVYVRSGTCVCYVDGAYPTSNANANGRFDGFAQYFHGKITPNLSVSIPAGLSISISGQRDSTNKLYLSNSKKLKS